MRLRIGDRTYEGRAVDLRSTAVESSVTGRAIVAAVPRETDSSKATDGSADAAAPSDTTGPEITVECTDARPVHRHVGYVRAGTTTRVRTALAAAARSRGLSAPEDEELASVRSQLRDLEVPEGPDVAAARERLAGSEAAVDRLRERVATLRGRVTAAREAGRDPSDAEAELADAVRELSERETERAAAREALERAREQARETRDRRERRRRLEDRVANLERDARAHLVEQVGASFLDALDGVPDCDTVPPDEPATNRREQERASVEPGATTVDGSIVSARANRDPKPADETPIAAVDGVSAALAIARVADLRAPVVLDCDRFPDATAAADWLGAPVVRL